MKIRSIEITGMHKIGKKIYNFSDLTYLHGLNGAGKSTVLQAVQLALLGYIPGQGKTNEAIMRHSNGNTLEVLATLEDNDNTITIDRTWVRTKKGIIGSTEIVPEVDLTSILADVELPIFNFSEFVSLSANKQKDWFVSFLPKSSDIIDWEKELKEASKDLKYSEDLLKTTLDRLKTLDCNDITAALKSANDYIKSVLSFKKSELSRIQSTIDSLIVYDDFSCVESEEELSVRKSYIFDECSKLQSELSKLAEYQSDKKELEALESEEDVESMIKHLDSLSVELSRLSDDIKVLSECREKLESEKAEAAEELYSIKSLSVGDGTCPYTKCKCETAENISAKFVKTLEEAESKHNKVSSDLSNLLTTIKNKTAEYNQLVNSYSDIKFKVDRCIHLRKGLPEVIPSSSDLESSIQEFKNQMVDIDNKLVKLRANNHYNSLIDKITKEKFIVEQDIEAVKAWIKLTDVNGLQTKFSTDSFESIKEGITTYLQVLFDNKNICADFNIVSKANSFSFGLLRDDKYIPFDLLSSGEKCVYTIALMSYISTMSKSPLSIILIDDILDHLDDSNIANLFNSLQKLSNIQYIFAGVKTCEAAEKFTVEL